MKPRPRKSADNPDSSPLDTNSSCSTDQSSLTCSDADCVEQPPRRRYMQKSWSVKATPGYTDRRKRNTAAVKLFRDRSKKQLQSAESEIARCNRLRNLFEREQTRLESARQDLERLIQLRVRGESIADRAYELMEYQKQQRLLFQLDISGQLSDGDASPTT